MGDLNPCTQLLTHPCTIPIPEVFIPYCPSAYYMYELPNTPFFTCYIYFRVKAYRLLNLVSDLSATKKFSFSRHWVCN